MRLWRNIAAVLPVAPVSLQDNEQRILAAHAKLARERAAFELDIAHSERYAATPALGKAAPQGPRVPY